VHRRQFAFHDCWLGSCGRGADSLENKSVSMQHRSHTTHIADTARTNPDMRMTRASFTPQKCCLRVELGDKADNIEHLSLLLRGPVLLVLLPFCTVHEQQLISYAIYETRQLLQHVADRCSAVKCWAPGILAKLVKHCPQTQTNLPVFANQNPKESTACCLFVRLYQSSSYFCSI
jgi:hypothetical protein